MLVKLRRHCRFSATTLPSPITLREKENRREGGAELWGKTDERETSHRRCRAWRSRHHLRTFSSAVVVKEKPPSRVGVTQLPSRFWSPELIRSASSCRKSPLLSKN
ncbi:hypothetical protein PIB30_073809, partial [Stylosanthes scabra]|nr:hypothetical protein [Stylosanthes scabra]